MKRTAFEHTKLKRLMRYLGIPKYAAVGILEAIWHITSQEAPLGDIGKFSNDEISLLIGWDDDPEALIAALICAGLLDEHATHRLVIHDWYEHRMDPSRRDYPNAKKNRRWQRVKAAGGELSRAIRDFILGRDGCCLICGAIEDLTIDHIIPVSKDGTNAIENLRTLCRPCNSRKKDRV